MTVKPKLKTPRLQKTILLQDSEGDLFCIGCKMHFGVISTDSRFDYPEVKYCVSCGAEVTQIIELEEGIDEWVMFE